MESSPSTLEASNLHIIAYESRPQGACTPIQTMNTTWKGIRFGLVDGTFQDKYESFHPTVKFSVTSLSTFPQTEDPM